MSRAPVLILLLMLAGAALAQAPDTPPTPHPDVAAFQAALRNVRSLQATVAWRSIWGGESTASVAFSRPGRTRVEMKGDEAGLWVRRGDRFLRYTHEDNRFFRGDGEMELPSWEGFSRQPVWSLIALLEPRLTEQFLLDECWFPRLRSLGTETVDGKPLVHLQGGASALRLDLWYSSTDGLPRRFAVRDQDGDEWCSGTVTVQRVNQPLPASLFDTRPPRGAEPADEPWGDQGSYPGIGPALERLAGRPRAADFRRLADLYGSAGNPGLRTLLLCQAARMEPTLSNYQAALGALSEHGAALSLTRLLEDGLRRFGDRLTTNNDLTFDRLMSGPGPRAELERLLQQSGALRLGWQARLSLVRFSLQRGRAGDALDLFLSLVPEGEPEASLRARVDAVAERSDLLPALAQTVPAEDRPRLTAALRRLETHLSPQTLAVWMDAYTRLGELDAALHLVEESGSSIMDDYALARLGDRLLAAGRREEAERVARQALAEAVTEDRVRYWSVMALLSTEGSRAILNPVLRQLAEVDRPRNPAAAGHWLFLADDQAGAMRTYRQYLETPAGDASARHDSGRCLCAFLGAEAASQSNDQVQLRWFLRVAVAELAFLRAEQADRAAQGLDLLLSWLPLVEDVQARAALEDRVIDAMPDLWLQRSEWSRNGGMFPHRWGAVYPESSQDKPPAETVARLKRVLPSLLRRGLVDDYLVQQCVAASLVDELVPTAIRLAKERPTRVPASALIAIASAMKEPRSVIDAVAAAVRAQPDWISGARALAEWYQQRKQLPPALELRRRLAVDPGDPADQLALAGLEIRTGRKRNAAGRVERLLAGATPRADFASEAAQLLSQAGRPAAALAIFRRMARSNHPDLVFAAVEGMRGCGAHAEARRTLQSRCRDLLRSGTQGSPAEYLRQMLVQQFGNDPAAVLRLYPELAYLDAAPAPDLLAWCYLGLPPQSSQRVARLLEQRRRPQAALAVEALHFLQGYSSGSAASLRAFVARCRQHGRLAFARDVLRHLEANQGRGEHLLVHAEVAQAAGERNEALRLYRRYALEEGDLLPHRRPGMDRVAAQAAELLRSAGKVEEADRWARWAQALQAVSERAKGAQAISTAEQAVALWPESPCLRFTLALRLWQAGRKDEARAALDQGYLRLVSTLAGVPSCVACQQVASPARPGNDGDRLAFSLERMLALDPQSGIPYYLAAWTEPFDPTSGSMEKRRERLEEAVRRSPDLAPAWELLCGVYQSDPRYRELLLTAAREWTRLQPELAQAWRTLAMACQQVQLWQESRRAVARANALDGHDGLIEFETQAEPPLWVARFLEIYNSLSGWGYMMF